MSDELANTYDADDATPAQVEYIANLLEKHGLDLRDALVESELELSDQELDDIEEPEQLTKPEASVLLDYLTSL